VRRTQSPQRKSPEARPLPGTPGKQLFVTKGFGNTRAPKEHSAHPEFSAGAYLFSFRLLRYQERFKPEFGGDFAGDSNLREVGMVVTFAGEEQDH